MGKPRRLDGGDRQAVGRCKGLCLAAPALGGGTNLCLAEPQPTPGQGCRSNGRERRDLALYCQRQADVAPSGCRMIDASEIFHAQSDLCHYKADSSQTLRRLGSVAWRNVWL